MSLLAYSEDALYTINMEMVDIVDNDLRVLYQVTKKEAHEKGLLHKCVIAEVANSQ